MYPKNYNRKGKKYSPQLNRFFKTRKAGSVKVTRGLQGFY